jgi:hypothetical protein
MNIENKKTGCGFVSKPYDLIEATGLPNLRAGQRAQHKTTQAIAKDRVVIGQNDVLDCHRASSNWFGTF